MRRAVGLRRCQNPFMASVEMEEARKAGGDDCSGIFSSGRGPHDASLGGLRLGMARAAGLEMTGVEAGRPCQRQPARRIPNAAAATHPRSNPYRWPVANQRSRDHGRV